MSDMSEIHQILYSELDSVRALEKWPYAFEDREPLVLEQFELGQGRQGVVIRLLPGDVLLPGLIGRGNRVQIARGLKGKYILRVRNKCVFFFLGAVDFFSHMP